MLQQSIHLTSVKNARELGGYPTMDGKTIKRGRILRTASLATISKEDQECLLKEYHLSTILDFRMDFEKINAADPELPGVRNLALKIIDETGSMQALTQMDKSDFGSKDTDAYPNIMFKLLQNGVADEIINEQMYIQFVSTPMAKESFGILFQELLSLKEPQSLLFHCSQGKDRTGLASMFILSALGAEEETILHDYMLTNLYNADLIQKEKDLLTASGLEGEQLVRILHGMDEVDVAYMQNVLNWLTETYGSPTGYLRQESGLTEYDIQALKKLFLE